jgi:hypothetical protein
MGEGLGGGGLSAGTELASKSTPPLPLPIKGRGKVQMKYSATKAVKLAIRPIRKIR